jgi:nucleotide-binding universal stress UspA family protein
MKNSLPSTTLEYMFKNLVVALDGSACSARALELALALAKAEGSNLAVCSVAEPLPVYPPAAPSLMAEQALAEVRGHAQEVVDDAVSKAGAAGITTEGRVLIGDPVYEIVGYSAKKAADGIVMGTHGRSGLKRLFMGSVAEGILRCSPVPVLTVREEARLSPVIAKAAS